MSFLLSILYNVYCVDTIPKQRVFYLRAAYLHKPHSTRQKEINKEIEPQTQIF